MRWAGQHTTCLCDTKGIQRCRHGRKQTKPEQTLFHRSGETPKTHRRRYLCLLCSETIAIWQRNQQAPTRTNGNVSVGRWICSAFDLRHVLYERSCCNKQFERRNFKQSTSESNKRNAGDGSGKQTASQQRPSGCRAVSKPWLPCCQIVSFQDGLKRFVRWKRAFGGSP